MENSKKCNYYLYYIDIDEVRGPYRLREAMRIKTGSFTEMKLLLEIVDENGRSL